jgi:hypothetical protein
VRQYLPGRQLLRCREMRHAGVYSELCERRAVLRKRVLRRDASVLRGFHWTGLRLAHLHGAVGRADSSARRHRGRPIPFEELSDQQTRNLGRRGCGDDGAGLTEILLLELPNSLEVRA